MRLTQGHSRYNLALCRRLSQFYGEINDEQPSQVQPNDKSREAAAIRRSAAVAPNRDDAVSLGDPSLFSGSYSDLSSTLSDRVIRSLSSCGFVQMTVIQSRSIPRILDGCDVLIRSATGSGKTLTFLVPALQRLVCPRNGAKITRQDGTCVMMICPTRELSVQTKDTFSKLARPFPWIVVAALKGGDSRKSEKAQIRKGITVVIGTPGRVLDHCESTASFKVSNMDMFVLDEADRLLDMGFEVKIRGIYKFLMSSRDVESAGKLQTVMTSATLTDAVHKLADFCLRTNRETIGVDDDFLAMPSTLTHEYVVVECKDKLICLISLLLKYVSNGEKVLIFVANCQTVVYFHRLLQSLTWPTVAGAKKGKRDLPSKVAKKLDSYSNTIDEYELMTGEDARQFKGPIEGRPKGLPVFGQVPIHMLHGSMEANDRAGYMSDFMSQERTIMVSTDVASRGLNLSKVDRVIQYDPPQQLEEYIHRSGRTARLGGKGNAILLLMPHEVHFIQALRQRGIHVKQVMEGLVWSYIEQTFVPKHLRSFKGYNISFLRNCFSDLVSDDPELLSHAQNAFRAAVQSYKSYARELRRTFDFKKLHLGHYAAAYCLKQRPGDLLPDRRQSAAPGTAAAGHSAAKGKGANARAGGKTHTPKPAPTRVNKGMGRVSQTTRTIKKVSKPSKPPARTAKTAPLSSAASQAALKAIEYLKSRNEVLTR
ncbi:DEAD/DEAH box helicase protein family, putative [Babesia bigemina]|uniref:ATP-dependent RNA helicase n=1 Tax=Babesia bigemina TaxID=5866 RepID=A0A061D646_BABBI|nr:DEAD/DEAH box helicase protein family, putative [Babesia bigemina]CDR94394.1 DEAD/DEAH box helicase protein family, putative [Babesia bigemina]|eukprot:XP_012766580.1 DEAD/DEAH box helicase protein family, putative [Babesia bigemina]